MDATQQEFENTVEELGMKDEEILKLKTAIKEFQAELKELKSDREEHLEKVCLIQLEPANNETGLSRAQTVLRSGICITRQGTTDLIMVAFWVVVLIELDENNHPSNAATGFDAELCRQAIL